MGWPDAVQGYTRLLIGGAVGLAVLMVLAVIIERISIAAHGVWLRRVTERYAPLVRRALVGDRMARAALLRSPSSHRITIARLILGPLSADRSPSHITAARELVTQLSIIKIADRWLRSPWWWRRVIALRALGGIQARDHTSDLVAALDDPNEDVRNTALDALADLQDPASLPAIIARLHDTSLHRARRRAVLAAFGTQCEALVLDLAGIDAGHRVNYALALGICGTPAARPVLCEWSRDARAEVRGAALDSLARVGIDQPSLPFALAALEDRKPSVRAMAAAALHGCMEGDTAARLGRHLDDTWSVAVPAARSLQTMGAAGRAELETRAGREDLPGLLARQMLWEDRAPR